MIATERHNQIELVLLKRFNSRECSAFAEVYSMYYDELLAFSKNVFRNTNVVEADVIHDIFIQIWQSEKIVFEALINIKAYIYTSIRNNFKNYIIHQKSVEKFKDASILNDDYFVVQVAESEIYTIVNQAIDLLPEDCATIFQYLIDGWSVSDIAKKLNKPERTVYNKKYEAVDILKRKMKSNTLQIILLMIP